MAKKMLHVRAVGDAKVHNYRALQGGRLQFVGRKYDSATDEWLTLPEGEKIEFRAEYVQEIREGNLQPLDQETCRICGVLFYQIK